SVLVTNAYGSTPSSNASLAILRGKGGSAPAATALAPSSKAAPYLEIGFDGSGFLILWPADSAWILEASSDPLLLDWVQVFDPPLQIGKLYAGRLEPAAAHRFYRLRAIGP